jgi:hypothetical protein
MHIYGSRIYACIVPVRGYLSTPFNVHVTAVAAGQSQRFFFGSYATYTPGEKAVLVSCIASLSLPRELQYYGLQ